MPELFQVGAKAIFIADNKALLLYAEDFLPHWDLPGGRLEANETIEEGLRRELAEELPGVTDISIGECIHVETLRRFIDKKPLVGLYYRASGDTNDLTLSDEHLSYLWIKITDILRLEKEAMLFSSDRIALEAALA